MATIKTYLLTAGYIRNVLMTFTKSGIAYAPLEELWLSGSYESQ